MSLMCIAQNHKNSENIYWMVMKLIESVYDTLNSWKSFKLWM